LKIHFEHDKNASKNVLKYADKKHVQHNYYLEFFKLRKIRREGIFIHLFYHVFMTPYFAMFTPRKSNFSR